MNPITGVRGRYRDVSCTRKEKLPTYHRVPHIHSVFLFTIITLNTPRIPVLFSSLISRLSKIT